MEILRFGQFVNEQRNEELNETGIPLYRGTILEPQDTIKRNKLLKELEGMLAQYAEGKIKEVTVLAEIPTQGKNTPQYLKDIYTEMGISAEKEKESGEDEYDEETDVFKGPRPDNIDDEPKHNIFVDSEFLVKNVDYTKNRILATPYSLKGKDIVIEIDPENVEEVFVQ